MRHDRTTIWLVKYGHHAHRAAVAHAHNPIADYRKFDPAATVETFEMLAVSELVSLLEAETNASEITALLHRIRGRFPSTAAQPDALPRRIFRHGFLSVTRIDRHRADRQRPGGHEPGHIRPPVHPITAEPDRRWHRRSAPHPDRHPTGTCRMSRTGKTPEMLDPHASSHPLRFDHSQRVTLRRCVIRHAKPGAP